MKILIVEDDDRIAQHDAEDLKHLKQVFTNLLQNALHYTVAGGSVTVEAKKVNFKIVVNFRDTGIGIAPEHIDKIFERFFRVDKSRSYQTGNSGLGLAIVREIVQLHKGTISVESKISKVLASPT